jgi:hypothetical protein
LVTLLNRKAGILGGTVVKAEPQVGHARDMAQYGICFIKIRGSDTGRLI